MIYRWQSKLPYYSNIIHIIRNYAKFDIKLFQYCLVDNGSRHVWDKFKTNSKIGLGISGQLIPILSLNTLQATALHMLLFCVQFVQTTWKLKCHGECWF